MHIYTHAYYSGVDWVVKMALRQTECTTSQHRKGYLAQQLHQDDVSLTASSLKLLAMKEEVVGELTTRAK